MRRFTAAIATATVFAAFLVAAPRAEAQGADNLADATDLGNSLAVADFGTDLQAGAEIGEPDHAGVAANRSVWLKWTAPSTVGVTLDTCHPSNFDTVLEVYWGPGAFPTFGNITSLASSNDDCGAGNIGSRLKFSAVANNTYYIVVDRAAPGVSNTYSVSLRAAPPNDDFSGAGLASIAPLTVNGTNEGATKEAGEPDHAGDTGGASVWWSWDAPVTDNFTIETCGSSFDTVLAVYTGGGFTGGVTPVVSNDDACGSNQSRVALAATAGVTYRIAVDGKNILNRPETGNITLSIAQGVVVADTTPPDTFITSVKREGRKATASFTGSDNLANGITFECKIDKGSFVLCASPKVYKLRRGKHTIQVRAIDAAGNIDPSPAAVSFRIRG